MSLPIKQRLENSLHSVAASGRKIASYMLANLHELPFQTSASIAAKLGVSESSVGRFCRALGYAHLKALKQDLQSDLGDGPWLVDDRLQEYRQGHDDSEGAGSLELEIAALVRVHEYSRGQAWQQVAQRLTGKPRVFIAGFQTERGVAMCAYPPFNYVDADNTLHGFDVDITNALCAQMKVEYTLVAQDWQGIIPALMARKYDAVAASMIDTGERRKKIAFTNHYYRTPLTMANADLAADRLGGVIADKFPLHGWVNRNGQNCCKVLGDVNGTKASAAIAVRKDDDAQRQRLNKALDEIIANGTYRCCTFPTPLLAGAYCTHARTQMHR